MRTAFAINFALVKICSTFCSNDLLFINKFLIRSTPSAESRWLEKRRGFKGVSPFYTIESIF